MKKESTMIFALGLTAMGLGQDTPWTPPTNSLPPDFVQTVRFLHQHGLGDPRGGELRRVKIPRGALTFPTGPNVYDDIIGWVLPERKGEPRRVVTLNGLTYPIREVGEPVDIDITLIQAQNSFNESRNSFLLAGLLLLRGEASRAEQAYRAYPQTAGAPNFWGPANAFLYAWWNQALSAHSAGDAKGALQVATCITQVRDDYEAEARRLGLVKPDRTFAFPTLIPLPSLLVDSRRRIQEGAEPIDLKAVSKLPAPERIKALIGALDDASALFIDDSPHFHMDPVVNALVAEGEAALPALFETIEQDPRLTRAVGGWRMPYQDRIPIPVSKAAIVAAQEILHARIIEDPARLKAFWLKTRDLSDVDRQILVLEDDEAGWQRWLEAAEAIFQRTEVRLSPERQARLAKTFEARARQVADHTSQPWHLRASLRMVHGVLHHAPKEARGIGEYVLKATYDRLESQPTEFHQLEGTLGGVVLAMMQAGHTSTLDRYLAALESRRAPAGFDMDTKVFFAPLFVFKARPDVQAATERTFLGDTSPWNLTRVAKERFGALSAVMDRDLIGLTPIQTGLLRVLDDRSILGDVEVAGPNYVQVISRKGHMVASFPVTDANLPSVGERMPMRVADALMVDLSRLRGAPAFAPTWPESRRDEAIDAMKRFLREKATVLPSLIQE